MMKELTRLPDAEFEVMRAVWKCGGVTVPTAELSAHMKGERKAQTVLTMLTRLAEKGFLLSEKNGKERLWTAAVSEDEYRTFEAKTFVEKVYDGSFSVLLNAFYAGKELSENDARELLEWIDRKTGKDGTP